MIFGIRSLEQVSVLNFFFKQGDILSPDKICFKKGKTGSILVCLSGRGDKDLDYVVEHYGYGDEFLKKMEDRRK